jgi:sulfite exporter TauE/SafE
MITAFLLGLAGSLHCAGMCGPLVLMTPVVGDTRSSFFASRLTYHAGRLTTYALIGALFGLIGESIVFAGLQRWLSISAGLLMILALFAAVPLKKRLTRIPIFVKSLFARFLQQRTFPSIFALGCTNGLLPCGLVYMAATASTAMAKVSASVLYMLLFGLGTLPVLLAISFAGTRVSLSRKPFLQKLAPIAVAAIALLLIVRGQPFIAHASARPACPACAR